MSCGEERLCSRWRVAIRKARRLIHTGGGAVGGAGGLTTRKEGRKQCANNTSNCRSSSQRGLYTVALRIKQEVETSGQPPSPVDKDVPTRSFGHRLTHEGRNVLKITHNHESTYKRRQRQFNQPWKSKGEGQHVGCNEDATCILSRTDPVFRFQYRTIFVTIFVPCVSPLLSFSLHSLSLSLMFSCSPSLISMSKYSRKGDPQASGAGILFD